VQIRQTRKTYDEGERPDTSSQPEGYHKPGPDFGRWTTRMLSSLRAAYGSEVDACSKVMREPDMILLLRIDGAMQYLYTRQPPKVGKKKTQRIKPKE
jgi:hypothetical protein